MAKSGHLWAVGYDNIERANQVREEIISLGWDKHYLILQDIATVVRNPDGSFTLNREPFPTATNGAPLPGATIGAMVGGTGSVAVLTSAGIGEDFVKEVEQLMKPGTSALFVLDDEGDMDVILHKLRSLGGTY